MDSSDMSGLPKFIASQVASHRQLLLKNSNDKHHEFYPKFQLRITTKTVEL
jgi:hypothetical protein